ncbi:vitamin B12-dependent ribonucleotide reductase [Mycoplasma sp. (ex Biomphalaria glabrata)]|uniref:vitamin B12-dependent ribonucleotide reductase n=1 Tax=Mycoplasma sp. (ex Biomphalaria glabrata) TaxID=1749074 RepID=UPI000A5AA059|nr:vitamin B12-dependent ribonucleotide reductase [Mycoplasma sp. (ex Biomphalaria glabrata)]
MFLEETKTEKLLVPKCDEGMKKMYSKSYIKSLNDDIERCFGWVYPIEDHYKITNQGISRLVMLDRYSQKDKNQETLKKGDLVVVILREDPLFPSRGIGNIIELNNSNVKVKVEEQYLSNLSQDEQANDGIIVRNCGQIEKPLEIFWEQIAKRVAHNLSEQELTDGSKKRYEMEFFNEISNYRFIPAGRVLYGAGSDSKVTYFNCFVLPFIKDSRSGISDHRKMAMEIMSRGGGVGTNGSTLRPKHAVAKAVGGRSSGAVSWLNDISNLTHLVEQGGSRRGAQMIMLSDWHPDIIEFIISKMQRPDVILWLKENSNDPLIREEAAKKIKFIPISNSDREMYESILRNKKDFKPNIVQHATDSLRAGGKWEVLNPEFLTGANISITLSDEFMNAVENDSTWDLRFPDLENFSPEEKQIYENEWSSCGDISEWENKGYKTKIYRRMKAKDLYHLVTFCATYSAEPGVFFIDVANKMTNAKAYGQKVVATNPCGEQPLAPFSVCNLGALNLAKFVDKNSGKILYEELKSSVAIAVRMLDNVIDSTPYFLEENREQAYKERRIGLGIMGLHDLLIWNKKAYGSEEGNVVVEKVMETICVTAYKTSIEIAKQKGSFPYLTNREAFIETGFMKKMPEDVRRDILDYGIRNSHLLTIAPTGSTGTLVGGSTGLEPYFAFKYFRSGRLGKDMEIESDIVKEWKSVNKYDQEELPNYFISAMELTPEQHTQVQVIIQRWVDSSISKTVNAPAGYSVENVEKIYTMLYKNGAKGGTVYVNGSRTAQVLSLEKEAKEEPSQDLINMKEKLRGDRQDREIGNEVDNICPLCNEGIVKEIGGCNTCTNCGAQLKCGL